MYIIDQISTTPYLINLKNISIFLDWALYDEKKVTGKKLRKSMNKFKSKFIH
jgi:hypothetical protein